MTASRRWANLGTAAGGAAAVLFAGFDLIKWAEAFSSDRFHNDFTFYYAAARIGLAHGWPSIYDLGILQHELDVMGSGIKIAALARFLSPPPLAWAATPLTPLPFSVAYLLWSALLLAALALTWLLAAPARGPVRLLHLAAAIGWLPVIYCLQLGQPGLYVALGVAASYAALRNNHPVWAGAALAALALKPQLAFLVPVALLVAGRYRAFWSSAAVLGVLALASAIALGPGGIHSYLDLLDFAATVPVNRALTLDAVLVNVTATRVAQAVIAVWALALVYRLRRRQVEWIFAAALIGGLLATPYVHLDDLLMIGLAAWLLLRVPSPAWTPVYLFATVLAVEGEPLWGAVPILSAELAGLVLISVVALRSGGEPTAGLSPSSHDGPLRRQTAAPPPAPLQKS
jgi:alpha-1,2-mannosyltransferase